MANAQDYSAFLLRVLKRCVTKASGPQGKIPSLDDDWSKAVFWKAKKKKAEPVAPAPPNAPPPAQEPAPLTQPPKADITPPSRPAAPAPPPPPPPPPPRPRDPPPRVEPPPARQRPPSAPTGSNGPAARATAPPKDMFSSMRVAKKFMDGERRPLPVKPAAHERDELMDWSSIKAAPEGAKPGAWRDTRVVAHGEDDRFMDWGGEHQQETDARDEGPAWYGGGLVGAGDAADYSPMDWSERNDHETEPPEQPARKAERKQRRRAQQQRRATCKVQARCRSKIERKKFVVTKSSVRTIQANVRRLSAMRVLAATRRAATLIQARLRGLRARKAARPASPPRPRTPLPDNWLDWLAEDSPAPSTIEAGWMYRPIGRSNDTLARLPTSLRASTLSSSRSTPLLRAPHRTPLLAAARVLDVLPVHPGRSAGEASPVAAAASMPALPTFSEAPPPWARRHEVQLWPPHQPQPQAEWRGEPQPALPWQRRRAPSAQGEGDCPNTTSFAREISSTVRASRQLSAIARQQHTMLSATSLVPRTDAAAASLQGTSWLGRPRAATSVAHAPVRRQQAFGGAATASASLALQQQQTRARYMDDPRLQPSHAEDYEKPRMAQHAGQPYVSLRLSEHRRSIVGGMHLQATADTNHSDRGRSSGASMWSSSIGPLFPLERHVTTPMHSPQALSSKLRLPLQTPMGASHRRPLAAATVVPSAAHGALPPLRAHA